MNDCKTVVSFENLARSIVEKAIILEKNSDKSAEEKNRFRAAVHVLCDCLIHNKKIPADLQNFGIKILYMNSTNKSTMKAIRGILEECGNILQNDLIRPDVKQTTL